MTGDNGKLNDKPPQDMAFTHKGKLVPKQLVDNQWKPGQSGNPSGKPRKKKEPGLAEYLKQFFDVTVKRERDGVTETVSRAQMLAEIIAIEAMQGTQPAVRRECLRIVVDTLWPIPKEPTTLLQITEHHTHRTIGFFADLEKLSGGEPITHQLLLDAYRKDFAGEFIDQETSDAEEAEGQAPSTEHDPPA